MVRLKEQSMREKMISGVDNTQVDISQVDIPKVPHWESSRNPMNMGWTTDNSKSMSALVMESRLGVPVDLPVPKTASIPVTPSAPPTDHFPTPDEVIKTLFPALFPPKTTSSVTQVKTTVGESKADIEKNATDDKQSEAGLGRLRPERLKSWESPSDLRDFMYDGK